MKAYLAGAVALLALTACSGEPSPAQQASDPAQSTSSATQAPAPTPSPTPTPTESFATPQQFASIIAMNEKDWREVIDGGFDCRLDWALEDTSEDPTVGIRALTCHMREATITMTANSALKDLSALTPDPSVESLVQQTRGALQAVVDADVYGQCETGEKAGTVECDSAHLSALNAYSMLEKALDGWAPYL